MDICPICMRPVQEKSTCPNCGITGICSYHIYKVREDLEKSPIGCSKCGPRCTRCGMQVGLLQHGTQLVCRPCKTQLNMPDARPRMQSEKNIEALRTWLTNIITLGGLGIGIYMGMQPDMKNLYIQIIKVKEYIDIVSPVLFGFIGITIGGIISSFISSFLSPKV